MKLLRLITLMLAVAMFLLAGSLLAKDGKGKITGHVLTKATNEPLIGANLFIPELGTGASTDLDGYFEIKNIPEGQYLLVAGFIGYEKQELNLVVKSGKATELKIVLVSSAVKLDELVVTGQGAAIEKRKLTTPVQTISKEEIASAPVESVEQLLQGRVPGLSSFTSSGMPGTSGRISTRGIKSTVTSSTPVVYVDGVRVDNAEAFRLALDTGGAESSAFTDLVVGEIENIEVIKGGAASTMFGSEAANGVIQIFTKKGVPGPTKYRFKVTTGLDMPDETFIEEDFLKNTVLQDGKYQAYEGTISGGSKDFSYSFSSKIHENTGLVTRDKNLSRGFNFATGMRILLQKGMTLELSSSYVKSMYNRINNNNSSVSPYSGIEDGTYTLDWAETEEERQSQIERRDYAFEQMMGAEISDNVNRFRLAGNYFYDYSNSWKFKVVMGLDYRQNEMRDFVAKKYGDFYAVENGYLNRADRDYLSLTMEAAVTYITPELFDVVNQTISVGAQGFRTEDREVYASGEGFSIPGTKDFDNAGNITAQESNVELFNGGFYVDDQIDILDKFFINTGFRVDANSAFGDDIGMMFYPKIGAAYDVTAESFYPAFLEEYWLPTFKLRGSYGLTGKFPSPFSKDRTYVAQNFKNQVGISFGNPGNDDIKPEKTASLEVGFDAGLFNNKLSVEFSYFKQITSDALFSVPEMVSTGFTSQLRNVGEIENRGYEVSTFAQIIQAENVNLTARFSYTYLENEVTSLGGAPEFNIASFTFLPRQVVEGQPVGVFLASVPVADADGVFRGKTEQKFVGPLLPKHAGSFSFSLSLYKDLTIGCMMEYALGHKFVNLKKALRWMNGTDDAADAFTPGYSFSTDSYALIEDADWIKIREITISYRMPQLLFDGVTLSASVRNVATFGYTANNDPELNGYQPNGADAGGYGFIDMSAPRQFRFGAQVNL